MRKSNLPKLIHFGTLSQPADSTSQKELTVWGYINATQLDCSCLKDGRYGIDSVFTKTNVRLHNSIATSLDPATLHTECGVKIKDDRIYGIGFSGHICRCLEHQVLPTSIRTGFANVSQTMLQSEEYDPKQCKLSFASGVLGTSNPEQERSHALPVFYFDLFCKSANLMPDRQTV